MITARLVYICVIIEHEVRVCGIIGSILENGADNEESRFCKGGWDFECKREFSLLYCAF
jgi:hypothetical protein